jgi:hypothetical protein
MEIVYYFKILFFFVICKIDRPIKKQKAYKRVKADISSILFLEETNYVPD